MIIESLCADDTFAFGKKLGEAAEPGTVCETIMERSLQALNRQESFTVPSVVESNTVFYSLTETAKKTCGEF